MNKPTKEEMLEVIDCAFEEGGNACDFPEQCKAKLGPFACSKAYEAIRRLIENQPKDDVFIRHIQQHLNPDQKVVCKICGKTANKIIKEASDE